MVFGMSLELYTLIHVLISLAGIVTGLVVMSGLLAGKRFDRWTALFLATTLATSITGFGFPVSRILPSHIVGALSLIVLTIAILARYRFEMQGAWRRTYVITAAISLYLNVFVGVVQAFQKVPALKALAPTQTESPFKVAQLVVFLIFAAFAVAATVRFQKENLKFTAAPLR